MKASLIESFNHNEGRLVMVQNSDGTYAVLARSRRDADNVFFIHISSSYSLANSAYYSTVSDVSNGGGIAYVAKEDIRRFRADYGDLKDILVGFFDDDWSPDESPAKPATGVQEDLKATCFYCEVSIPVYKMYDWSTKSYSFELSCRKCNRKDSVKLTDEQVKQCNEGGGWQAFLGK